MAMIGARPYNPNPYVPPVNQASPPKPKVNWAGVIADALSGLAGQPGQFAEMQARRKEDQTAYERGDEQWRRHHNIETQDARSLLDYKRNLGPDDQFSQYLDAAGIPTAQRPALYQKRVDNMVAPPMMSAPGVDEQGNPVMRFFPRATPQGAGAPPVGTVKGGYRFKGGNPADQSSWEPVGGPTPSASGAFP